MKEFLVTHRRFIRYLIVGGSTYLLYVGVLYLLGEMFKLDPAIAFLASFLLANIYNYLAHYFITFGSAKKHGDALISFIAVVTIGTGGGFLTTELLDSYYPGTAVIGAAVYGLLWPFISYYLLKKHVF